MSNNTFPPPVPLPGDGEREQPTREVDGEDVLDPDLDADRIDSADADRIASQEGDAS
ncbi:hypothetical protein QE374_002150 [Microbacterium sp. SORGH_AS428]|uniref:hypothetical protein n=1 Tax=Microbacterium sp. SORGH_AS_0428 TaxID=3041788 RepID=UPI002855DD3A|nr:hypothetical protein [Microbacterium sp. SORGH_AS_0428]MDR6200241.1 hypothetical protein [Microbacterium sp. SORGH_AS_0428]